MTETSTTSSIKQIPHRFWPILSTLAAVSGAMHRRQIIDIVAQGTVVPYVSVLQISGLKYSWATSRADARGRNAADPTSFFVNGVALDVAASYTVAVSDFLAGGGDGYMTFRACSTLSTTGLDIDMFVNYLGANRPLSAPPRNRIIKIN